MQTCIQMTGVYIVFLISLYGIHIRFLTKVCVGVLGISYLELGFLFVLVSGVAWLRG